MRPWTINWGLIIVWMNFHSNLSCAALGFVTGLAPVCHLRAASAGSWLRREKRSWFCRDGNTQHPPHQKDLPILPFPLPVCTCLCLERGQWSPCPHRDLCPSLWPLLSFPAVKTTGSSRAGAAPVPKANSSQTLPFSSPPQGCCPRNWALSPCFWELWMGTNHAKCPAGALSGPIFLCPSVLFFLSHKPGALWPLRKLTYLLIFLRAQGCNSAFITSDFRKYFWTVAKA